MAGLLAVALALGWQGLVIRYTFAGNWTAWFCTGGNLRQPPLAVAEKIYVFPASGGYDSQFYHYVAHDPMFHRGLDRYIDAPRLRYRRILVPGLAFLLAAGQDDAIDTALIVVSLLFVFAGAYWLARYAGKFGRNPMLGALFLLSPAMLVSLDRLTVDLALTALCVGFALYVQEHRRRAVYLVLLLAPLARETGLLLTAAYCMALLLERRFKYAALFATSAIPALAWYIFVQGHTAPYGSEGWFTLIPFAGIVDRMTHPVTYPFIPIVKWLAEILDECALAGAMLAFLFSFRRTMGFPRALIFAAMFITLSAVTLGQLFWSDVFAFGRVFSPLFVLIALQSFATRSWVTLLPVVLVDPRIGLALAYKLYQVAIAVGR